MSLDNKIPLSEVEIEFLMEKELKEKAEEYLRKCIENKKIKVTKSETMVVYEINSVTFNKTEDEDEKVYLTKAEKEQYSGEYFNIIEQMANSFYQPGGFIDYDELISAAGLGFTKALNAYYKNSSASFKTFLCTVIQNELRKTYNAEIKKHKNEYLTDYEESSTDSVDVMYVVNRNNSINSSEDDYIDKVNYEEEVSTYSSLLNVIEKYLDPKEKHVICSIYGINGIEKKTQTELAHIYNLTQPTIFSFIQKTKKKIKDLLEKEYNITDIDSII